MRIPILSVLLSSSLFPLTRLVSMKIKKSLAPVYRPTTKNQELYVRGLQDKGKAIVLGVGPAGCGKTLFACTSAVEYYNKGFVDKIIMTRPVVPVEEEIGFLPGSLASKMEPWTRPLFDIFHEYFSVNDVQMMMKHGIIEIAPFAFMRGRTFKKAFIIADEMQNSSPKQMLMLTTRMGEGSKMVITGDLKQSDLLVENGLRDFLHRYERMEGGGGLSEIEVVKFLEEDVKRSAVVSTILRLYDDVRVLSEDTRVLSEDTRVLSEDSDVLSGSNATSSVKQILVTTLYDTTQDNSSASAKDTFEKNMDAAILPKHHISKHFPSDYSYF